ncbi:MAG: DUF2069 domain-containing protein [Halieaceae bacterium]|jgi:uncharacterized membrane protein
MRVTPPRNWLTHGLWIVMWLAWIVLLLQQAADVERFAGTWALTGLRCAPLTFFLWAAFKDGLRLFIWYELILLFYFISSVEAAFAYRADVLSIVGLSTVVIQFTCCMLYIRFRGREVREAA